jgi:hypothetical protein
MRTHPLLPSEALSSTVLLLLLRQLTLISKPSKILSVDVHEIRALPITITEETTQDQCTGEKGHTWRIRIERPEKITQQIYHLTAMGQILQMEEDDRLLLPVEGV